jgi:hypothetical protein
VNVAGYKNKPNALGIWPGQDQAGVYTKRCIEFADEHGWQRHEVCRHWSQVAMVIEFEGKRDRIVAEDAAWRHVLSALRDLRYEETN